MNKGILMAAMIVFIDYGISHSQTNGTTTNILLGLGAGSLLQPGSPSGQQSGTYNVMIGVNAGNMHKRGAHNVLLGTNAGENSQGGNYNLCFGWDAGKDNYHGSDNIFLGRESGKNNWFGNDNIFLGSRSGGDNTAGSYNVFAGHMSGRFNERGNNNVFFGYKAGFLNTLGSDNVYIGTHSGYHNKKGNKNTSIGHEAGMISIDLENSTTLGYGSTALRSNSVILGNDLVNVGIGTGDPFYKLHVKGGDIFAEGGGLFLNNTENIIVNSKMGSFHTARGFDFNPNNREKGIKIETGPMESESGGFYVDGDYAVIWSPGDHDRLLRVYDEDGMKEKWYLNGDGAAFSVSDQRAKENIATLNGALDKIKGLRGVNYNFITTDNKAASGNARSAVDSKEKESEKSIGFLAQELETVFPEAVDTDDKGNKFVSYDAIIPLLVEAMKEQQKEIEELRASSNDALDADKGSLNATAAQLFQNVPNPFNKSTSISYYLPSTVSNADMFIYDLQGKFLKQYKLDRRGKASIEISAGELEAGMYVYSLIADDKEIDYKRMILTK